MPTPGAVAAGRVVTSATTGSVVNLCPRDCTVLGFYANATTTIVITDSAATAAVPVHVNVTACAIGWNWLPITLVNGLAINQAAQVWFVVV